MLKEVDLGMGWRTLQRVILGRDELEFERIYCREETFGSNGLHADRGIRLS
jgi:hypothetical protein